MSLIDTQFTDMIGAKALISIILKQGYSVTVNDGEEDTLIGETCRATIYDAMATTDWDYIAPVSEAGEELGYFWLIYGEDADPSTIISDYSVNDVCDSIYSAFETRFERYSR